MTKKPRQLFLAGVKRLLLDLGAEQHDDDFVLKTKVGRLTLSPSADQPVGLGTVLTRFDDPHAARRLVDCDRISGRWNHHYSDAWAVETAIDNLSVWLGKVLA